MSAMLGFNEINRRRAAIVWGSNPDQAKDFLVSLDGGIDYGRGESARFELRYIPDRVILDAACLEGYLTAVTAEDWSSMEALAICLLDDLNNELVPRWIQVRLSATRPSQGRSSVNTSHDYRVVLEDRQPEWDNPALLARL